MRIFLPNHLQDRVKLSNCLTGFITKPKLFLESECVLQCAAGDNACLQNCAREYADDLRNCPCQENCPTGCPCPDYQCPATTTALTSSTITSTTTTPTDTWILVLNTYSSYNVPLIIDGRGQSKEIGFNYGSGTEVENSCSIVWRGQMVVFGGKNYKRQISVVEGCKLTNIGELPFLMELGGACAQRDDAEIFVCFEDYWGHDSSYKDCHYSTGPLEEFSKLPSSTYDHQNTRIAVTSGKLFRN